MSLARLAAAAAVAAALFSSASAADEPAPLKFAWPVPSKVTVTERVLKGGHTAITTYTASLERSGESGDLRLHLSDFGFLEFDGRPPTDPSIAQQIKMALPMAKAIPDLLIGADGALKDVLNMDAAIATLIDELTKAVDERQKAQIAALRTQFDAPEMRERMKRDAAKHWAAWVANWSGRVIPEGKGVEGTWPVSCPPDGKETAAPTLYKRMSAEKEGPGLVKLTRESTLDGEDAQPALDAYVARAAAMGMPIPATGMRLVDRVAVVTDPETLRPTWVRREEQRTLRAKDKPDWVDVERHEYTFEWVAAGSRTPTEPVAPIEPVKPAEGGK